MTTKEAVDHLVKMLKEDEGYRIGWRANIAVQFQDAFARDHRYKGVHEISNDAAEAFLKLLCHDNSDTLSGDL